MGIFATHARRLFENNLSIIPTTGKEAFLPSWSQYNIRLPNEKEMDLWETNFADCNIGICLGEASKLHAFDFDSYDKDFEKVIREMLPPTPLFKFGVKGFTAFFKYNGTKSFKYGKQGNGKHIFEFFGDSGQTIIPPSIHPDTGKPYTWETPFNFENTNVEDLPEISKDCINKIKRTIDIYLYSMPEEKLALGQNRHLAIVDFIYVNASKCFNMLELVEKIVAFDKSYCQTNSYLNETKNKSGKYSKTIEGRAEYLADSVLKSISKNHVFKWKTIEEPKKKVKQALTYEDYKKGFESLEFLQGSFREKLTKTEFLKNEDPILNNIGTIKSMMSDLGFNINHVTNHLDRWMLDLNTKYSIDFPEWDGVARIRDVVSHLKVKNIQTEFVQEIMCEWMAGIFKKVDMPTYQQLVPILCGGQGKGKDYFIEFLCGGLGMSKYFCKPHINEHKANDLFQMQATHLVGHLEELDQYTYANPSFMKSVFTTPYRTYRAPYMRKPGSVPMVCSFIGTTNHEGILQDPTGNRRYALFIVDDIDRSYSTIYKGCQLQLIAEAIYYNKHAYSFDNTARLFMSEWLENVDNKPVDMMEVCVEIMIDAIRKKFSSQVFYVPVLELKDDFSNTALRHKVNEQRLREAVNKLGFAKDYNGRKHYKKDLFEKIFGEGYYHYSDSNVFTLSPKITV